MHPIPGTPVTIVDLLRHGMPQGGGRYRGSLDDPLAEEGWAQMWEAAGRNPPWSVVVTSPLRRCAEFAVALARRDGLPVEQDPRLREVGFGGWEGHRVAELLATDPEPVRAYWRDPVAHPPPGGEPLPAFRERVVAAWETLLARHEARHVLLVGHGGVLRMLLAHVLEMPLAGVLRLEVPHASLTRIRVQPDINARRTASLVFHARTGGPPGAVDR